MAEDRWDKIGKLLDEARKRPPDERAAFLDEACDDASVRDEVLSLLEAEQQERGFFDDLASALPASPEEVSDNEQGLRVSDPLDLEGTTVGRYEVESHLGGGGMGVVYKAHDPELGRAVALKFLPPHLATSDEAEERFVREARAASALDHPHIATIYEIGVSEGGHRFIAMAYYEGETLKEKLAQTERLSVEDAVRYAEQIASALARAHDAGIVHRDVKPANVMVTADGEVKLLDFGLAKAAAQTRLTEPGRQLGTAAYMSPEQAQGIQVGPPTDRWALGIVLHEMLTGTRPFPGERNTAILHNILHGTPTPLDEQREVPGALPQIVNRCLQKDPSDRYPSTELLVEELRALRREIRPAPNRTPRTGHVHGRSEEKASTGLLARAQWFYRELRRRHVLRVAAVYAGTGFVLLQLGEILVQPFGLPPWTLRLITLALILGFPLAVSLAWAFDFTKEGLVRDRGAPVPSQKEPTERPSLPANLGTLALLVVGIVGLGWVGWQTWHGPSAPNSPTAGVEAAPPSDESQPARSGKQLRPLNPAKVAVLYFEDNSPNDTLTAFANGFTDHLTHRLSQVEGLEVVSQHGVERYRTATTSPDSSIARSLGAGSLIRGSVWPVGNSLSVFVRLIDGKTQATLMSEMIRRPAKEVFALQNDLAGEVSRLLRKRLGRQIQLDAWRAETQSTEAWRLVQRADRLHEDAKQLKQEDQLEVALGLTAQADSLLAEAMSIDPDWSAPAALRARLATVRVDPYAERWSKKEWGIVRQGIDYATEALRRDSTDTEARAVRGRLRFWLSGWVEDPDRSATLLDRAERDLRRAIRESTGEARAMYTLSRLLLEGRGDSEQALYYAERARKADAYLRIPSQTQYLMFYTALNAGKFENAAHWCYTGQQRYPTLVHFRDCELILLATEGAATPNVDRAWELLKEIRARTGPEKQAFYEAISRPNVAAVLARAGLRDSARAVLRRTRRGTVGTHPASSYYQAHAHLLLGDEDEALNLLANAVEHSPRIDAASVASDVWFESLRGRPRFQEIVSH